MNIPSIIIEVQEALGLEADGAAGPQTWAAIHRKLVAMPSRSTGEPRPPIELQEPEKADLADERSEKTIATLLPEVRPYARALVHAAAARGIALKIISGLRTDEEQNALFAKRPRVTKARGGYSNHNFGIAFDVGIFAGAKYLEESPLYKVAGALGMGLGLEWGGNWKSFQDEPHFQLRPKWALGISESAMLATLRERKARGQAAFV